MSQPTMNDFFSPKRREDGDTDASQEPKAQSSCLQGERRKSDSDAVEDQPVQTPVSSLEIDEEPESSESDESSEDDQESDLDSPSITTPKFSSMSLSKFRISRSEKCKRVNAGTIIENFMARTGKKFKKASKRKIRSRDRGQGTKKRCTCVTERNQRQNSGNANQQTMTSYMEGTVPMERQSQQVMLSAGQQSLARGEEGLQLPTGHGNGPPLSSITEEERLPLRIHEKEQQILPMEDDVEDESPVLEAEGQTNVRESKLHGQTEDKIVGHMSVIQHGQPSERTDEGKGHDGQGEGEGCPFSQGPGDSDHMSDKQRGQSSENEDEGKDQSEERQGEGYRSSLAPGDSDQQALRQSSGRGAETTALEQESVMSGAETEPDLSMAETIGREARELDLREDVRQLVEEHPSGFSVKIYVLSTPSHPEMYAAVKSVIKPEQMTECKNVISSFIIFFYREDDDGPEIFVMTSGQAYSYFTSRSCPMFPKKVAKRLLPFETIEFESRNVTGDTRQIRKLFLHDSACCINIWDVIDAVIHKFKAFPKESSSIYNLRSFKTKKGKKKHIAFTIRPQSLVVNQSTTIKDMQEMIAHFSDIDKGKPTRLYESKELEEDDNQFEKLEFIQEVHDDKIKKQLKERLQDRIKRCLKKGSGAEDIHLSMEDLKEWLKADKFILFLRRGQKPLKTWEGKPPMLSDVIKAVRCNRTGPKQKDRSTNWDWLSENVQLAIQKGSTIGKRYPIINFLVGAFLTSDLNPYFLWHGKWLKIKMEYQTIVAESYNQIIVAASIEPEEVLPLPWASSDVTSDQREKVTAKHLWKTMKIPLEILENFLNIIDADDKHTAESVKVLLNDLHVSVKQPAGVKQAVHCEYNRDVYQMNDKDKLFALSFLRLHSNLDEGMYNATYILLNQILAMTPPKQQLGYIVGDKILSHNIEMFDILMYTKTHTYLVHVKEGFDHHVRDVCSQIRNSADLLLRDLTSHSTHTILDEMWEQFVKEQDKTFGTSKNSSDTNSKSKKQKNVGNRKVLEKIVNVKYTQSKDGTPSAIKGGKNTEGMKNYKEAIRAAVKTMGWENFSELFTGRRQIVYVLASRNTRKDANVRHSSIEKSLQKSFGENSTTILQLLKMKDYVMQSIDKLTPTDEFRIAVKKKPAFVSTMIHTVKHKHQGKTQRSRKPNHMQQEEVGVSYCAQSGGPRQGTREYQDRGCPATCTDTEKKKPEAANSLLKKNVQVLDQSDEGMTENEDRSGSGLSVMSPSPGGEDDHFRDESVSEESSRMSEETEQMETGSAESEDSATDFEEEILTENSEKTQCGANFNYWKLMEKTVWEDVYDILKKHLPNTKSTIAQMELLSLSSHFRNYQIGRKKFQLKVCSLSKSTEKLGDDLEKFLKLNN